MKSTIRTRASLRERRFFIEVTIVNLLILLGLILVVLLIMNSSL